jgi:DNA-binding CsgD family transcriptional regulator
MGSDKERPEGPEAGRRGTSAVAWVDLRVDTDSGPAADMAVAGAAHLLRQVTKAVRGGDRVCPAATSLVAVEFGSVASAVPLVVLGDRIARAVGPTLPFDRSDACLGVAVGTAGPVEGIDPVGSDEISRRALGAARSGRSVLGADAAGGIGDLTAVVIVDLRVTGHPSATGSGPSFQPLHRRSVHRYCATRAEGLPGLRPADPRTVAAGPSSEGLATSNLSVLVVDPMAADGTAPGFALTASANLVERLGCRTGTAPVSPDEPLLTTVDGTDIDLVVLVLDGAWVGRSPNWATGAWGLPARLTTAYVDKGIPVLAVSAGAGAGAIASCVAQGALALFDLDSLADALRSLDGLTIEEARQVAELGFADRFRALLGLTAGERRVLFYLTEGWAAQDIAEELVVSLTTVRSHIRSVLRKLEVRSQLAAVAIANSRDLEHHTISANS